MLVFQRIVGRLGFFSKRFEIVTHGDVVRCGHVVSAKDRPNRCPRCDHPEFGEAATSIGPEPSTPGARSPIPNGTMRSVRPLSLLLTLLASCSSSDPVDRPRSDAAAETSADATTAEAAPDDSLADTPSDADARDASCKLAKPYSSKDAECNACAQSQCCEEVNGCFADKRCDDDYVNCILACALLPEDAGDAAAERDRCVAECDARHPEGKRAYDAAIGCVAAKCPGACE